MIKLTPFLGTQSNATSAQPAKTAAKTGEKSPEFEKKHPKREYSDPLMQWPIRGLAFTNDIGAAISDIAPKAGMMMWIPALMYFGADIYDKYRNDKESYDPNSKRGLKQACFQTLASVVFPIVVVHAGQKTASILSRKSKDGLSLQSKEEVVRHHLQNMSEVKLSDYVNNKELYKKEYNEALDNMIDETMRKYNHKNPVKLLFNLVFSHRHPEAMGKDQRAKIHGFINKRIDNMFEMREQLLEGKKQDKMSEKMFKEFEKLKETYKNDKKYAKNYDLHAVKDILKKFEEKQIYKTKMVKTIGGFISLGVFIKFIDYFVENVIMHKYIGPGIDKINKKDLEKFKNQFLGLGKSRD